MENVCNRVVDSYGNILKEGEPVLVYNYRKVKLNNRSYFEYDYYLKRLRGSDLVKFNGSKVLTGNNYLSVGLRMSAETCNSLYDEELERLGGYQYNINYLSDYIGCKEETYMERANQNNLRGMPMQDILGRKLKLGDFVYFFEDDKPCYGLVMSETQVFSNYIEMKTLHHVILMEELCDREIEQKKDLMLANQDLAKLISNQEVHKGDIYKSKGGTYLYLGDFSLVVSNNELKDCTDSWIRLKYFSIKDLLEINTQEDKLNQVLVDFVEHSAMVPDGYNKVTNMNNILDKVPRTSYLVGHIDISSLSEITVYGSPEGQKNKYKFQFIFK